MIFEDLTIRKWAKFVYQHKGSGIIVDNIFKPIKTTFGKITGYSAKKLSKKEENKALESGSITNG